MTYPSWADVGIPTKVVNSLKGMKPSSSVDTLVHQLVFRTSRKVSLTYVCDRCGFEYEPNRASEDYFQCVNCGSSQLHAKCHVRFPKESVPQYSRTKAKPMEFVSAVYNHHLTYFGKGSDAIYDCGWTDNGVYSCFAGGEKVNDLSPRMCLVKAAILTPYLWDMMRAEDPTRSDHITPLLAQLTNNCWK